MALELKHLQSHVFHALEQNSSSYVFLCDTAAGQYRFSRNGMEHFGLPGETFVMEDLWARLLHTEDYAAFSSKYLELAAGKQDRISGDYRFRENSGVYFLCRFEAWADTDPEREPARLISGLISFLKRNETTDPVTGLPGNNDFRSALKDIAGKNEPCAVLMIGIDEFKNINDFYSYSFGDKVLAYYADFILSSLPRCAMMFRLDGDGFGILFSGMEPESVQDWFSRLQHRLRRPVQIDEIRVSISISAGLCLYPEDGREHEILYRNSRVALYAAKQNGKDQLARYTGKLVDEDHARMLLRTNLRQSVITGFRGFSLHYQPIVHADCGRISGAEALLRWDDPAFPPCEGPCRFIPVLEESGLILEVGRWVLEQAVQQCARWISFMPDFQMNINVASVQFEEPGFKFFVIDTLAKYGLNPCNITLELTESGKIKKTQLVRSTFDFLRSQGVNIALDDFGTGYASLDVFRVLSADELKIDRSFLDRITYDVIDQKLISVLVDLCHSICMKVCVEGIESQELESVVRQLGPDLLQGYYYNRPLTADAFAAAYFDGTSPSSEAEGQVPSEYTQSMVYSAFRPAQPLSIDALVDNAHAGVFQVGMDNEFTFLTCNEGYRRMLGYTAAEMEHNFKNHALGFVHPDDMRYVNEEIRRQLGQGDTITIEFRVVRKDGSPIWILGTGNVVRGRHGASSLVVVIVNNDRLKKKELALAEEHALYKKLLDHLPVGIKCVRFDPDFTIDYISPGFLELLGYSREDISRLFDDKYINLIYEEDRKVVSNDILEQLKLSDVVHMRYRSLCRDGRLLWVETISRLCAPDADGIQRPCSGVIQITDIDGELGQNSRGLNIVNRYQMVTAQWGEYLFEIDFPSRMVMFSENFGEQFEAANELSLDEVFRFVHTDELASFREAVEEARGGKRPRPVEMRFRQPDGSYRWYSAAFSLPEKFRDTPITVIGRITDIDTQRRERIRLLEQSQHDSTTGLLNKGTTEERIRSILSHASMKKDHYALLMMDIDNFKSINDTYGHFNGDEILRVIAARLRCLFGNTDIVGRVGGDEFMAFLPFSGDTQLLEEKAQTILEVLHEAIAVDGGICHPCISIGLSCYPGDGTHFYDLFRRADSALYRVKERGKDGFYISAQ